MPSLKDIFGKRFGQGRNWAVLLISFFLAVGIWLISNLSGTYSGTVTVPVRASCNIDGHAALSEGTLAVSAICRSDGFRLLERRSRQPAKVIRIQRGDLRQVSTERFYLAGATKNSYIQQIFGEETSVEAFLSDTLFFVFPLENHVKVPVELVQDVSYRPQYMRASPIRLEPDSVTIYGDASRLEGIERVTTAQLRLNDVHEDIRGNLHLQRIKGVRMSVEEVSYTLDVERYVEVRATLPLEVWNAPPGRHLQVFPSQAEVVMRCAFPLRKDPLRDFKAYIDYKDFASSLTGRCVARTLRLPAGVLSCRVEPEVFDCIETE